MSLHLWENSPGTGRVGRKGEEQKGWKEEGEEPEEGHSEKQWGGSADEHNPDVCQRGGWWWRWRASRDSGGRRDEGRDLHSAVRTVALRAVQVHLHPAQPEIATHDVSCGDAKSLGVLMLKVPGSAKGQVGRPAQGGILLVLTSRTLLTKQV